MNNIRKRLVVWHTGILAVLLLAFTAGLYLFLKYHLNAEVDGFLVSWTTHAGELLDGDGRFLAEPMKGQPSHLMARMNMNDSFVLVFDANYTSKRGVLSRRSIQTLKGLIHAKPLRAGGRFSTMRLDSQIYRIYITAIPGAGGSGNHLLVLGRSLIHVQNTLSGLKNFLAIAWGLAVFACTFISWNFVGRTLQPVNRMTRDSLRIAASGELGRRVEYIAGHDEFGELAKALNRMLASLETAAASQKRFLADASHELRTPLTSIMANLDFLARAADAPQSEQSAALQDSVRETKRMATLIHELLALSRAEATPATRFIPINLVEMMQRIGAHYSQTPQIQVKVQGPLYIEGDPEKLRQMVVILLDNAFKYAGKSGAVELQLRKETNGGVSAAAVLEVTDQGPGIPEAEIPRVFERFYRASNVKDAAPGSGLGLSIARTIVRDHGGDIELRNHLPHGLKVTVSLPAVG